jgi:hypothetical protein
MAGYNGTSGLANDGAVCRGAFNSFSASGASSPVAVQAGVAVVIGGWYRSDSTINISVPTPISATRIDRIVLTKNWAAQTIRMSLVAGAEGSGVPPALTQVSGTTWMVPLYQVKITTGGVITLLDEREYVGGLAYGPFVAGYGAGAVVAGMSLTHIKGTFNITMPPSGGRIMVVAQHAFDFTNLGGPYFTEHSDDFSVICYMDGAEEFRVENEINQEVSSVRHTLHLNSVIDAVPAGLHTIDFYAVFGRSTGSTATSVNDARWTRYDLWGIAYP